jgi:16S rRNA (cytidine1402-2'-O)-methyltransferase
MASIVYLVPTVLDDSAIETIPHYIVDAVQDCAVIFAENERTARRFLKRIRKEIVIDDFEWHTIHKVEEEQLSIFRKTIKEGKNIAIISEAGCPGIADPGQLLVAAAQEMNAIVRPLVGPSSILLALMASGMNGQQFSFVGYLPIDNQERAKAIQALEHRKETCIFIETPYRNNQLLETILKTCKSSTRLCVAVDITSRQEFIRTKTVAEWKTEKTDLHKKQAIFLLQG